MIYRGTVKGGVVILDADAVLPEGTSVNVEPVSAQASATPKRPGTSLADWAENNAESWGDRIRSDDVESFTGRKY
jgi:hypothetical protein